MAATLNPLLSSASVVLKLTGSKVLASTAVKAPSEIAVTVSLMVAGCASAVEPSKSESLVPGLGSDRVPLQLM
jgi:hypothetical protein